MLDQSAFIGGVSQVEITTDDFETSVVVDLNLDFEGLDFTEDIFSTSMSGRIILNNTSGWDGKLKGVQGTEWITLSFSPKTNKNGEQEFKGSTQRFKVYKVNQSTDRVNRFTSYIFYFTTYQFLVDSLKFEGHLSNKHIGPISTESESGSLTNQDYGLVNKIFDVAGFELDISRENTNPIDIESTGNWINYIPSYLDDRNTPESTRRGYYLNRDVAGINNNDENQDARPKKVFELLGELAENAVSKENPNAANFFVWHDLLGWHFRSIDSYLRDRNEEVDKVYTYDISNPNGTGEETRIIELNSIQQVDFMDLLNKQALSSKVVYYELNPDNEFASYYATLPANLGGLQKVIGPNGLDSSLGNTAIETQAIIEGSIEYDYLKDKDKWNSVETYPLIRSSEKQFSKYTQPSFLEVPPVYMQQGIGNSSWYNSSSYDLDNTWYGWYNSSYRTVNSFYQTNPDDFFRTKFARQMDLPGDKFRVVHDNIKMPIIDSLKEYYDAAIQRLYYEHNFVIDSGLNSLETGEGTLGRGIGQGFCEYCSSRDEMLDLYGSQTSSAERNAIENWVSENSETDNPQVLVDRIILGEARPDSLVPVLEGLNPEFYAKFGTYIPCTKFGTDFRYTLFSSGYDDQADIFPPEIEVDNVPRLSPEYIGQSYPRCENQEPLLPYNGDPVDCETLKQKWNNIPSECALITQYLGKEYCSPAIRGKFGDPINFYNNMFWNSYWLNPRFGIPNTRTLTRFFGDYWGYSRRFGGYGKQFFETNMFIKDFRTTEVRPSNSEVIPLGYSSYAYSTYWFYNYDYYDGGISDLYSNSELVPSHYIFAPNSSLEVTEVVNIPSSFVNKNGETIQVEVGPGSTRTFERSIDVSYQNNPEYSMLRTCAIPRLCGHVDVAEETLDIPYVSKVKLEKPDFGGSGENIVFVPVDIQVDTVSVTWPALYGRGNPYAYSAISTLPPTLSEDGVTEFLRQFSAGLVAQFGDDDYFNSYYWGYWYNRGEFNQPVAATLEQLYNSYTQGNYYPNDKLGLTDGSNPIWNAKDWQNFLDCNGTCVGLDNAVTDTSRSVEYAKYCSYAWNRYWSTPKEQPLYRRAQVALIQSQEIEIVVPNDMDMSIGKLVRVDTGRSPDTVDDNLLGKVDKSDPLAGKYLVTGIRRVFDRDNSSMMRVRLNRDSLPYDPSE